MTARGGQGPEVVLATSNRAKQEEIRWILGDLPLRWISLDALSTLRLPPEGDEYAANAIAKAEAAARTFGRPALADDSGLEVAALGGRPGPQSARFGGPGLTDAERIQRLLAALAGVPTSRRQARFVCLAALATAPGRVVTARGECRGRILEQPRGNGGFGYDPVFELDRRRSMAEVSSQEKDRISHRALAFRGLVEALRAELGIPRA